MGHHSIDSMPTSQANAGRSKPPMRNSNGIFQLNIFKVWDGISDALITFNQPGFNEEVAYIVENDVLLHAILEEIKINSNITIQNNAKIDKVQLQRDGFTNGTVYLKNGEIFSAELLVSNGKQSDFSKFSKSLVYLTHTQNKLDYTLIYSEILLNKIR